ncbi:hypothetical protein D3C80_962930 [compost metagenome]
MAQVNPQLALKLDKSAYSLAPGGAVTNDPNTDLREDFLTQHPNAPDFVSYWYIKNTFFSAKALSNNRHQIAYEYNPVSVARVYSRSSFQGVWSVWVRCDLSGTAAAAHQLATPRLINGVSFNGTANINIPAYQPAGSQMDIGKYLDFRDTGSVADADLRLELIDTPYGKTLLVHNGVVGGTGTIQAGALLASNWFRSLGVSGWINDTFGGGIYMEDTSWVRVAGGKNFLCAGLVQATAFAGNGSSLTGVTGIQTTCAHNSAVVEFGAIYLTGGNTSLVDLPAPYVMMGMRTGSSAPHGVAWLRGVTMRTW